MTQQLSSSPASNGEILVEKHIHFKNPVSDPSTNTLRQSDTGTLSLERCIEIYRRTKRCNHLHTENQYPYGCGVKLVCCIVCPKILEKIVL